MMMQTNLSVSVVICAYTEKRWNALVAAVKSVQKQTFPAREIILVIDRNPSLLLRVRDCLEGITVIENEEAKGASGARNSGVAKSCGEIIAFLDDDAIAAPDWIKNLVASYADPSIVGVGGKIDPLWLKARPSWFPDEFNWVVGCTYRGMPMKDAPVRNVIGANMSVRKQALEMVGGFRESFGNNKGESKAGAVSKWLHHQAGDEETELCIRIAQQLSGSIWLYAISAIVQHQVPAQRTCWSYFLWRCYDEGLGKANLAKLHLMEMSLSSETSYTFKVLPGGIVRGLSDAFLHWDIAGLSRAGAIVSGFAMAVAGYLVGSIVSQRLFSEGEGLKTEKQQYTSSEPSLVKVESSTL